MTEREQKECIRAFAEFGEINLPMRGDDTFYCSEQTDPKEIWDAAWQRAIAYESARTQQAAAPDCAVCSGKGWYSDADPSTGDEVQVQCEPCCGTGKTPTAQPDKAEVVERVALALYVAAHEQTGVSEAHAKALYAQDENKPAWLKQAKAALSALPPQRGDSGLVGWQPIETAPKDGTSVLLGIEGDFTGVNMAVAEWDGEGWLYSEDGEGSYFAAPTHWALLPKPPAAQAKSGA